jgi:hypothetical protein
MKHRDFHQACCSFNWGWQDSDDPNIRSAGYTQEHQLRQIALESESLQRILVKAEAAFWQRRVRRSREVRS